MISDPESAWCLLGIFLQFSTQKMFGGSQAFLRFSIQKALNGR
jgi:hypothetical protein